jgi:serine/threonine protein kinase
MGEVWKARDTRLDRTVAIKVLKDKFSERFEREAHAVAALNHPHICQLYDVGPDYLVMELVEGTPLKGPLPVEKAVEYAGQILDALDAAHRKGITHRDLKPANILVTKQGIKLLDFGLAKQAAPLKETDVTNPLTEQGQIVGTLQYMSPEQLQEGGGRTQRSVRLRLRAVRDADGEARVRWRERGKRDRGDPGAGAGTDQRCPSARSRRPEVSGQGCGSSVSVRS